MGNLQHEATTLLNFGVLYFMKLDYEKSIEYFKKALSIFSTTGDQRGEGLVSHNLGEIYYLSCEYGNSLKYLSAARTIFENLQDINEELETLFMLGIYYAALGSKNNLSLIINDFKNLLMRETGERHSYNYRFLKLLQKADSLNFFHEIKSIIHYYNNQSVKNNFFRAVIKAVEFLYRHNMNKEALEELNNKAFSDVAETNQDYKAWQEYYFGLIKLNSGEYDIHPSEHFLKALGIIEKLNISELTWKVMTVLADFYYSRGNFLRAEEYAYYSFALIEHIAEGIGEEELKNSYMSRKDIRSAIDICKKILPNNG
jgi:tetratricopeptide (TPR) repeat protein